MPRSPSCWRCALAGIAPPARGADDDLPARVGRIADLGGAVYVAPEDRADEWAEVGRNYPVASGDNLWVSGDGRAEIDFGGGRFRLAGDTNVHCRASTTASSRCSSRRGA